MRREEVERLLATYDAERYARELPEELIETLASCRTPAPGKSLERPQRLSDFPTEGLVEFDPHSRRLVCRQTDALSRRQREALALASHGLDNPEIAEILGVALETVKAHLRGAYALLAAKNRAHACAIALRAGLIP